MPALAELLDAIARAVLGDGGEGGDSDTDAVILGSVTLRSHQREALRRVRASIERDGGALLADEPGLGKTFVALALAREFPDAVVAAPATLRPMWRDAAIAAAAEVRFVSFETLSRRGPHDGSRPGERGGLVIVDEAHHACNPRTARYARLARLAAYRRVLLLSATPVRNRRAELGALLALFMGPRAHALDDATRAHCIVRRTGDASLRPVIDGPNWHRVRATPGVREMIATLPPALPALDGRAAAALLSMTLARCWASSLAALDASLRRRLQRGAALQSVLDAGRLPTRGELRAWVVGDDAVQLAFPALAAHETPDAARLRGVLDAHLDGVRALRERVRAHVGRDTAARAALLLELRRRYDRARIVAFTSHAATAEALYRALHREHGVALLTARGARTAGGARPRADVTGALATTGRGPSTRERARDEISLVITTDLLSEGVNLQRASVVVHLDVPWTPAGLDQRVGRAARMGSPHACVHVHGIAPPAAAERLLTLERRLARKHAERTEAARPSRQIEELRALLRPWCRADHRRVRGRGRADARARARDAERHDRGPGDALVGSAAAARPGFVAVVESDGAAVLVCGNPLSGRRWNVSDSPGALALAIRGVRPVAAEPDPGLERRARAALERWLAGRRARERTGAAAAPSRARRLLLARFDAAVRGAGAHARAGFASRIARVRVLVDAAISAGAERSLDALAREAGAGAGLERLLATCEERLAGGIDAAESASRCAPLARRRRHALRALLLLRPGA